MDNPQIPGLPGPAPTGQVPAAAAPAQPTRRGWGSIVSGVISRALFGDSGQEPTPESPAVSSVQGNPAFDPMASTVAGMGLVERHIVPVTTENLAALALLHLEARTLGESGGGEDLEFLANFWQENHQLRGGPGPLLQAMESSSLIRQVQRAAQPVNPRSAPGRAPAGGGQQR